MVMSQRKNPRFRGTGFKPGETEESDTVIPHHSNSLPFMHHEAWSRRTSALLLGTSSIFARQGQASHRLSGQALPLPAEPLPLALGTAPWLSSSQGVIHDHLVL